MKTIRSLSSIRLDLLVPLTIVVHATPKRLLIIDWATNITINCVPTTIDISELIEKET